jgi:cytochrome c oxidase subunit 2
MNIRNRHLFSEHTNLGLNNQIIIFCDFYALYFGYLKGFKVDFQKSTLLEYTKNFLFLTSFLIFGIFFLFGQFSDIDYGKSDIGAPWQFGLSDPGTPIMEGILLLHNDVMFFLILVSIFVLWVLLQCIRIFPGLIVDHFLRWRHQLGYLGMLVRNFRVRITSIGVSSRTNNRALNTTQDYTGGIIHYAPIEVIWTTVPTLLLMVIAMPSLGLLYAIEESVDPSIIVKCTGSQWYWSYESTTQKIYFWGKKAVLKFDSFLIPAVELEPGTPRLLMVSQNLELPICSHVEVKVTSSDVLHSWAVPSLGVKVDACPGRLNQTSLFIKRASAFFGQCSEICGVNHGFMPIVALSGSKVRSGFEVDRLYGFLDGPNAW